MADTTTFRVQRAQSDLRRSNIHRDRMVDITAATVRLHGAMSLAAPAITTATPAETTAGDTQAAAMVEALTVDRVAATAAVRMVDRIAPAAAADTTAAAEAVTAPVVAEATAAAVDTAKLITQSLSLHAPPSGGVFLCGIGKPKWAAHTLL